MVLLMRSTLFVVCSVLVLVAIASVDISAFAVAEIARERVWRRL